MSDTLSRYPNRYSEMRSLNMSSDGDREEESSVAAVGKDMNNLFAVTLEHVEETSKSEKTVVCCDRILNKGDMVANTTKFWRY